MIEVCDSFLTEAPQRIEAIKIAFANADAAELSKTAHALKSLSSCVGATALFEIAQAIESIGKNNRIQPPLSLIEQVSDEYQTVQLAIKAYKDAHQKTSYAAYHPYS